MAIEGLTVIGESINDSVPSTKKLFEAGDIDGIMELARFQEEKGAAYIDVNVGLRSPGFMADLVKKVQDVTTKPLSIDTPDVELAAAGLEAYDPERAGGKLPILNSISPTRLDMFDIYAAQPFMPILLSSEHVVNGDSRPNRTGSENYESARFLLQEAHARCAIPNDQCIFDPGIAPIGSDTEGINKMVFDCLRLMHEDTDFQGAHRSVGLSNFTVMIPPKRADGSPVKSPLESAFLTLAMPLGLDTVIGSVKRKYRLLEPENDAMVCLNEALAAQGHNCIIRIMEFYT